MMRSILDTRGRVVHGAVLSDGSVSRPGSGDWFVNRTAVGVYYVRFSPFNIKPSVIGNPNGLAIFYLVDVQTGFIQVNTYSIDNTAGISMDSGFSFRCEGR